MARGISLSLISVLTDFQLQFNSCLDLLTVKQLSFVVESRILLMIVDLLLVAGEGEV